MICFSDDLPEDDDDDNDDGADEKNEKIYLVMVGLLYSTVEKLWKKLITWSDELVVVFSICDPLCKCG